MEQKELFLPALAEATDHQKRFGRMRQWFHKVGSRLLVNSGIEFENAGLNVFEDDIKPVEAMNDAPQPKLGQRRIRSEVASDFMPLGSAEQITASASTESVRPTVVDRTRQDDITHLEWKKARMAEVTSLDEYRTAKQNYLADPLNAPMPAAAAGQELIHDHLVQEQYGPFDGKHVVGQ